MLSSLEPNVADDISAADLLATTTLSIDLTARQVRNLLEDKERRMVVYRLLRAVLASAALTDLEDGQLDRMWDLYSHLKTLVATEESESNRWVFAAKFCARKRPELFPVRDRKVCSYLAGGHTWGKAGQIGNFSIDMQVFADAITDAKVAHRLDELRSELQKRHKLTVREPQLRMLDVALWTQAMNEGY